MARLTNIAVTLTCIVALAVVTGCGRRGSPVTPSQAAVDQAKADKRPAPARPTPNSQNPEKKFILDGLLK
ncbi:hypothetical protein [Ahrensia sp. R2A130]|uniref:hypothetical protein n=1 Tax=Ahrensia sp. R2A130 TaxID=744979 RepID=UPI0001E0E8FC|nr:hypothetical protein [Ahrensia sp. R2A130]EFL88022.1 putative lipoprotein [Ahrensia sp. R2A130]